MAKFESATYSHLKSYTLVNQVLNYVFSYQIVSTLYAQVIGVADKAFELISFPAVISALKYVDTTFNKLVLNNFDAAYGFYAAKKLAVFKKLQSINASYYAHVAHYLPSETPYKFTESEISNTVGITKEIYFRSKAKALAYFYKSKDYLLGSYSEATKDEPSYVNVASKLSHKFYSDLNDNYVQPLKSYSKDYVDDVTKQSKQKVESLKQNNPLKEFVGKINVQVSASA